MKQIWITKAGDPDVLQARDAPDPEPRPGELLIDVRAAGVNFADILARVGMYPDAPPIPCVVGYEVAGTVAAIGTDMASASPARTASAGASSDAGAPAPPAVGDRVVALTRFGGYATRVAVPADRVWPIPGNLSFAEAAAIPVNYFTAVLAIDRFGSLRHDERMLVHNAGGGVGIAAIQLGVQRGAEIYGTASGWKHERLRAMGAHHLIDYRATDWVAELQRITGGAGMHLILDPIGGRNLKRDLEVLGPLGRLIAFGFSEPVRHGRRRLLAAVRSLFSMPRPHMLTLLNRNWSLAGLNIGHLWSEVDRLRDTAAEVMAGFESGALSPVIAAEVPFDDAPLAHRLLQERKNIGKVVLVT